MTAEPIAAGPMWRVVVGSTDSGKGLRLRRYRDVDAYLHRDATSEKLLDHDATLPTRHDVVRVAAVDFLLGELGWERVTGWTAAPGGYETAVRPKEG